jgi:simple sugar transport system substrate-binding protein
LKKTAIIVIAIVFALVVTTIGVGCKATTETTAAATTAAATTAAATTAAAETTAAATTAAPKKDIEIVFVHKLLGIPWIFRETTGVEKAAKDLGIKASLTAPQTSGDVVQQVKIVEDLVARGVSGIVVVPVDPASMVSVFKKAKEKGIVVITSESENQEGVDFDIEPFNNFEYGKWQMDQLVKYMGPKGNIACFTGELPPGTPALNTWIDGALAQAKEKYPDIKEVTERLAMRDDAELTYNLTLDLINTYPELTGIFTTGASGAPGAAKAVEEKKLNDKISVGGTSIPSMCGQYLDSGALDFISAWDPAALGYSLVASVYAMINGQMLTDGQDVPQLGKITLAPYTKGTGTNVYGQAQASWDKNTYKGEDGKPLF